MDKIHFSSASNEWETPRSLFNKLNDEFNFQLDAACTIENALCTNFFTLEDDSLIKDWFLYKSVWVNPPYGRAIGKFVKKAFEESSKGCTVVVLIPARTDVKVFHDYCMKAKEIRFIRGRLKFINKLLPSYRADGEFKVSSAPFPSMIVVFDGSYSGGTKFISY